MDKLAAEKKALVLCDGCLSDSQLSLMNHMTHVTMMMHMEHLNAVGAYGRNQLSSDK